MLAFLWFQFVRAFKRLVSSNLTLTASRLPFSVDPKHGLLIWPSLSILLVCLCELPLSLPSSLFLPSSLHLSSDFFHNLNHRSWWVLFVIHHKGCSFSHCFSREGLNLNCSGGDAWQAAKSLSTFELKKIVIQFLNFVNSQHDIFILLLTRCTIKITNYKGADLETFLTCSDLCFIV